MQVADPVLLQHVIPAVVAASGGSGRSVRVETRRSGRCRTAVSGDDGLRRAGRPQPAVERREVRRGAGAGRAHRGARRRGDHRHACGPRARASRRRTSERLFDLFYRTQVGGAARSGAGIGLFVCRQLVHAMGGRIWVRAARRAAGRSSGSRCRSTWRRRCSPRRRAEELTGAGDGFTSRPGLVHDGLGLGARDLRAAVHELVDVVVARAPSSMTWSGVCSSALVAGPPGLCPQLQEHRVRVVGTPDSFVCASLVGAIGPLGLEAVRAAAA